MVGLIAAATWWALSALAIAIWLTVDQLPEGVALFLVGFAEPVLELHAVLLDYLFGKPFMGIHALSSFAIVVIIQSFAVWLVACISWWATRALFDSHGELEA